MLIATKSYCTAFSISRYLLLTIVFAIHHYLSIFILLNPCYRLYNNLCTDTTYRYPPGVFWHVAPFLHPRSVCSNSSHSLTSISQLGPSQFSGHLSIQLEMINSSNTFYLLSNINQNFRFFDNDSCTVFTCNDIHCMCWYRFHHDDMD